MLFTEENWQEMVDEGFAAAFKPVTKGFVCLGCNKILPNRESCVDHTRSFVEVMA